MLTFINHSQLTEHNYSKYTLFSNKISNTKATIYPWQSFSIVNDASHDHHSAHVMQSGPPSCDRDSHPFLLAYPCSRHDAANRKYLSRVGHHCTFVVGWKNVMANERVASEEEKVISVVSADGEPSLVDQGCSPAEESGVICSGLHFGPTFCRRHPCVVRVKVNDGHCEEGASANRLVGLCAMSDVGVSLLKSQNHLNPNQSPNQKNQSRCLTNQSLTSSIRLRA
jgi:hypothetical protein